MKAALMVLVMVAAARAEPSIQTRTDELDKFHTGEAFAPAVARAVELFGKTEGGRDQERCDLARLGGRGCRHVLGDRARR